MTPAEIDFVSQRIAAVALARGDCTVDQIVERILSDVPEAEGDTIRAMVILLKSVQDRVKVAIPKIRKKQGDAAFPSLEGWKVDALMSEIMSAHRGIDREALESLIGWTDYYFYLR